MNVEISHRAYEDLESIKIHIEDNLQPPQSAKKIMIDILDTIKSLNNFPNRGAPLNTLIYINNDKSNFPFQTSPITKISVLNP